MLLSYKSHLHNIKRFVLALSGKPLLNYFHIFFSYYASLITGNVFTAKMPFAFSAEVSAKCNLRCPECIVGIGKTKRKKFFMNIALFEKLLYETYRKSFYINLYFQGEPFLNKDIFDFIIKAKSKRFYTVISTNGHFLDKNNNTSLISSGLDKLVVSLDGISGTTYTQYRKAGDFEKVINGIHDLVLQKKVLKTKHPFIVLQFLVHRKNEDDLKHLKSYARHLGVDSLKIKSMQFRDNRSTEELSPSDEKHRRYRQLPDGTWRIKGKRRKPCFRIWSQAIITSDGDVVPCCYDKIPEFIAGNINDEKITQIWKGNKLNTIRSYLLSKNNVPGICNNCYG